MVFNFVFLESNKIAQIANEGKQVRRQILRLLDFLEIVRIVTLSFTWLHNRPFGTMVTSIPIVTGVSGHVLSPNGSAVTTGRVAEIAKLFVLFGGVRLGVPDNFAVVTAWV